MAPNINLQIKSENISDDEESRLKNLNETQSEPSLHTKTFCVAVGGGKVVDRIGKLGGDSMNFGDSKSASIINKIKEMLRQKKYLTVVPDRLFTDGKLSLTELQAKLGFPLSS